MAEVIAENPSLPDSLNNTFQFFAILFPLDPPLSTQSRNIWLGLSGSYL